jgi:hypothetical protein
VLVGVSSVTSFISDPVESVETLAAEANCSTTMSGGNYMAGGGCALTGICEFAVDCGTGDAYRCGYGSSQLAMDTTLVVAAAPYTYGAGSVAVGALRAGSRLLPDVNVKWVDEGGDLRAGRSPACRRRPTSTNRVLRALDRTR